MDLDRSLSDVADGYRPDRQPSLDDLVRRSRSRRRTTMALSALSVIALVAGVALALERDPAATRVIPYTSTTPTAPPVGCELKESHGIVDYIDFVYVGNRSMDAWMGTRETRPVVREADLGEVVTHVRCRLEDHYMGQQAEELKDGYASFVDEGAPIYAVRGYDPRCRVAARWGGELRVYLAADPDAKVHRNAACSLMPGLDPDGPPTAAGDERGAPAAFRDRTPYRDCGSIDARPLGRASDAGSLQAEACFRSVVNAGTGEAEVRSVLGTIDAGPGYEVLRVKDGAVELWLSGYNSSTGPHVGYEYWHHETCTGLDGTRLTATGCTLAD